VSRAPAGTLAAALLSLLVVAAYANSLRNGFTGDDHVIIVQNKLITRLHALPTLFARDYWASSRNPNEAIPPPGTGLYRPVVLTTYALNYAVGGLSPVGYHAVNLLLHLLVTWLVYRLAWQLRLSPEGALAAAAIFAVHPLHTEAVTGIVGRAELLMAASVLGGLLLAVHGFRWLAFGAFTLGLFAKEQAAVLPALLLLSGLCLDRSVSTSTSNIEPRTVHLRRGIARYGGYVLILAAYLAVRGYSLGGLRPPSLGFLENPAAFADWPVRLLTLLKVAGRYLWLFVWPGPLSSDYSYNAIPLARSVVDPGVLWSVLAWGSLIVAALWAFRRDGRVTFSIGLMVVTFLPVSNVIIPIGTLVGERLFYLPSAGLCLLAGWAWDRLYPRLTSRTGRVGAVALVAGLCLVLTVRTVARNQDWADNETLFRHDAQVVPENAKVYAYLGKALKDRGAHAEALQAYQTALRLYPDYAKSDAPFNAGYGDALLQTGRVAEGVKALEQAVSLDPQWSSLHYNLGLAYARQGDFDRAEKAWRRALALYPRAPHIHSSLSRLFIERGRYAEALAEAEAALAQDPDFLLALGNRAWALESLGRLEEAAAGYELVLAKNPGFSDLRAKLASLRARMRKE
jgi:tetratricopeptide (TPR) repeat protein